MRRKDSRGATRSKDRAARSYGRIGEEGILARSEYDKGLRGVGFAHKLHRVSDVKIDQILLRALGVDNDKEIPYQVQSPRHVTSIPYLSLDDYALQFLNLGRETAEFLSGIKEQCEGMDEKTTKSITCEIGDIIEIGGKRVVGEVDNARVSKIRSGIRSLFEHAGVAIPEMHATHLLIGQADSFRAQHRLAAAASEYISGTNVEVHPVEVYTNTYTELIRPTYLPTDDC